VTLTVSTPTDTDIVMVRAFDAPRPLVFDAITRPELLRRWHGARGWNLVSCEVDLRAGGRWRFVSRGPGGEEMGHGGVYLEVAPPERIVYTETFDDPWYAGECLVTTVLTGGTTMTSTLRYESREVRDTVLRSPMERGVTESLTRLAAVLVAIQGESS
jgi:uncharacterized protein YndB with AHSA1/START domain